jgi:hypothetical protein
MNRRKSERRNVRFVRGRRGAATAGGGGTRTAYARQNVHVAGKTTRARRRCDHVNIISSANKMCWSDILLVGRMAAMLVAKYKHINIHVNIRSDTRGTCGYIYTWTVTDEGVERVLSFSDNESDCNAANSEYSN